MAITKQEKRNLRAFPTASIGRDMCSQLFSMSILNYILFTKNLTVQQFSAVSAIIVAARIFDAFNDPIMGTLLERTNSKFGKFKPWMLAGVLSTSVIVFLAFSNNLFGWSFVGFFAFIYFMFSICFTMNDVSYWGMIPALSSDPEMRNKFTSRTVFFSGMGGAFVTVFVPIFTAGAHVIGGNAVTAYRTMAAIACTAAPITMMLVFLFVRENRANSSSKKEKVSLKRIFTTIIRNDQLKWAALIFLFQQVGNAVVSNGLGSTYIYLQFGYNGTLATLFTVIGMSSTVVLMLIYPALAKKYTRNLMVKRGLVIAITGYLFALASGLLVPESIAGGMAKYACIVLGFAIANAGSYCIYMVMMICMANTVEYNEYKFGVREEGIIASVRPFLSKLGNAIALMLISLFYIIAGVTVYTNKISELENSASQGVITAEEKQSLINMALSKVTSSETVVLLLAMTLIPLCCITVASTIYKKKYKIDEKKYMEMLEEIERREPHEETV